MRQVLRAGALGRPRGMGWRGSREGGSGWETHVNPWLIHVNVWQKPLQCCKVISLQLIKINGKKYYLDYRQKKKREHFLYTPECVCSPNKTLTYRPKCESKHYCLSSLHLIFKFFQLFCFYLKKIEVYWLYNVIFCCTTK